MIPFLCWKEAGGTSHARACMERCSQQCQNRIQLYPAFTAALPASGLEPLLGPWAPLGVGMKKGSRGSVAMGSWVAFLPRHPLLAFSRGNICYLGAPQHTFRVPAQQHSLTWVMPSLAISSPALALLQCTPLHLRML